MVLDHAGWLVAMSWRIQAASCPPEDTIALLCSSFHRAGSNAIANTSSSVLSCYRIPPRRGYKGVGRENKRNWAEHHSSDHEAFMPKSLVTMFTQTCRLRIAELRSLKIAAQAIKEYKLHAFTVHCRVGLASGGHRPIGNEPEGKASSTLDLLPHSPANGSSDFCALHATILDIGIPV